MKIPLESLIFLCKDKIKNKTWIVSEKQFSQTHRFLVMQIEKEAIKQQKSEKLQ